MHRPKSNHMTRTCHHHMLFVGGVGFYSKITFLTPISRSKVIRGSKSYDMIGQGQGSLWPSLVKIHQVTAEVHVKTWWQKKKKKKKKEFVYDRTRRHVCRLVKKKEFVYDRTRRHVCRLVTSHGDMAHKTAPSNCDEYDLWPQIEDPKVNTSQMPCICAIVITKLLNI